MQKINGYDTFLLYNLLERVDYEWDFDNNIETDYINNIQKTMTKSFKKSLNKKQWFKNFLEKIKGKKRKLKIALIMLILPAMISNQQISKNDVLNITSSIDPEITETIKEIVKKDIEEKINPTKFDPIKMEVSDELVEHLKNEEKLELTAYALGDGKITIGYGHAEPIKKSKFKVGDKITLKQADKLFRKDLKRTEKGIKRIFKHWKKQGIDILLTQSQYDAMVSMGYNMGISGLRQTEFIQLVKQGKMEEAAEKIKTTKLRKGFPGLVKRRLKEYELFSKKA
jgi:lysozyme